MRAVLGGVVPGNLRVVDLMCVSGGLVAAGVAFVLVGVGLLVFDPVSELFLEPA